MRTRTLAVALAAMLVLGMTGVTAYTTANADRDITVNVEKDDAAVIGLVPGNGATLNNGELLLNLDGESLNENAVFTYGEGATASTNNAFKIVNNDDVAHNFTLSAKETSSTNTDLTYRIYDADGNQVASFSEGGSATVNGVSKGGELYVVVEVNTGNDAGSTYDGTFTVDA